MVDIVKPIYGEAWASSGEKLSPTEIKVQSGWVQEMMPYQWENFLQNRQDTTLLYLLQKGVPEWSGDQEYIGNKSIVTYNGYTYQAKSTNTGNLPTDSTYWKRTSPNVTDAGVVTLGSGGTGATNATDARTNLGLGTAATVSADTIVFKSVTGNAPAADKWTSPISVSLSGGATGTALVDGSANATINVTGLNASSISSGTVPSTALSNATLKTSSTGSTILASGSTSERDLSPAEGYARWNKTTKVVEVFNGTSWVVNTSQSETYLLNRANHTGTQAITTVSGLQAALDTRVVETATTGAALLPSGTTSQRPDPVLYPNDLLVRGNTDTGKPEWYNSAKSTWQPFGDAGGELFNYAWHNGPRSSIDVGRVATDGQQLLLLTHPDVCQAIWDGKQHAVDESVWQSDPTKRNCWSLGDGTSWVRVPDLNAATAGTDKPFYLRGSPTGLNGTSVGDAIRNITGTTEYANGLGLLVNTANQTGAFKMSTTNTAQRPQATASADGRLLQFDASAVVPTADENRVKTAYGVMTVRVFTEVSNVGALDAGQLATQLGVVDAQVQTLDANTGFTIIYPNGGTQATPANVAINSRYVESNPFTGFPIMCSVELLYGGEWSEVKMGGSGAASYGADAGQNNNSSLVLVTGTQYLITASALHYFSGTRPGANVTSGLPCRIKVWKLKGGA